MNTTTVFVYVSPEAYAMSFRSRNLSLTYMMRSLYYLSVVNDLRCHAIYPQPSYGK